MNTDDIQALMGTFLTEAEEFLLILETQLLELEATSEPKAAVQAVKTLFRVAHSLKGSALMFGLRDLARAAHLLEDCFAILRDCDNADLVTLEPAIMTGLLQGVDYLKSLTRQLSSPTQPPPQLLDVEQPEQQLTVLKQQLTICYPKLVDPASYPASPAGQGLDLAIVQAIFEYELPGVLDQMAAQLVQVQHQGLTATRPALTALQAQLAGAAAMLQLPGLEQIALDWQQLLDSHNLSDEQFTQQGEGLLAALQQLRQQVLAGQETILLDSIVDASVATEGIVTSGATTHPTGLGPTGLEDTTCFANLLDGVLDGVLSTVTTVDTPAVQEFWLEDSAQSIVPLATMPVRAATVAVAAKQQPSIRVDLQQLNELINLVGELVINRTNLELQSAHLRGETGSMGQQIKRLQLSGGALRQEYDRLTVPQQPTQPTGFDPLELDHYDKFHATAQSVIEISQTIRQSAGQVDTVARELEHGIDHLQRITQQLRNRIMQLRVVPFSRVVDHLPRALRELCRTYNKEVNLLLLGRETKIDENLLEALRDPLLHLLRNAFDHGIETPAERIAAGKPPCGQIEIRARHQGGQTLITFRDDGRGIDPHRVRQRIVERGMATPEQVLAMGLNELYDYLTLPGFSTTTQVTDLSGRGVGLDVVRSNLQRVRGSIKIESRPGQGTTFLLKLPLMLSIIPALIVRVGQQRLAVPLDAVEEILEIAPQQLQKLGDQQVVEWREGFLQVVPLAELLHESRALPPATTHLETTSSSSNQPLLILSGNGMHVAVQVDALLGHQEIVIKPLPTPLAKPSGIVGSTIIGAGDVVLILDVDDVFSYANVGLSKPLSSLPGMSIPEVIVPTLSERALSERAPNDVWLIMVVDDAYTIRQLLARTLSRAHYRVVEAKDGQDALDQLQRGLRCQLIITDLEMPRMDGFEFVRSLRSSPQFASIPVAVLTSRTGAKHRSLATELGADHYFTKPYREEELLQSVAQLMQADPPPTH